MNINNVVVTGRLVKDALIVESEGKPGRFDVEFVIAINHRRQAVTISDKATYLTVKMNTTENGARFFSHNLYKGREVLATGGICSRTTLGPGSSTPFIYVEAATIQVIGEERSAGQSMECGPEGMIESAQPMAEPEPVKPALRTMTVQRPGTNAQPHTPPVQSHNHHASTSYGYGQQQSEDAARYRDKGATTIDAGGSAESNLCRW